LLSISPITSYILKVSWEARTLLADRQGDILPQFHRYFQAFPTTGHDKELSRQCLSEGSSSACGQNGHFSIYSPNPWGYCPAPPADLSTTRPRVSRGKLCPRSSDREVGFSNSLTAIQLSDPRIHPRDPPSHSTGSSAPPRQHPPVMAGP
jgi:hypothetical protein